jgi:ferredoxin
MCQGHGQCQESAPKVFEVRDDGISHVLLVDMPSELEDDVRDAAARCPVEAVLIGE